MKKLSNLFLKLSLACLLAGSLVITGCGSNPAGSNTEENKSENSETANYTISCEVVSTSGYLSEKASFKITCKGPNSFNKTVDGSSYTFTGLEAGTYSLSAEEKNNLYKLETVKTVITSENLEKQEIRMIYNGVLNTFNFKGVINDNQNKGVQFAKITADNGIKKFEGTTNPDNGNFTLEKLTPGSYDVTVSAPSFTNSTLKLFIDEEGKSITLDGSSVSNFDFGIIKLTPNYASSGSIEGILKNPSTGMPLTSGSKVYIYKRNNDPTVKPSFLCTIVIEKDTGYFTINSLQADYYAGAISEVTTWDISTDKEGNPLAYNIPSSQQCFTWLQVNEGTTSKIPGY